MRPPARRYSDIVKQGILSQWRREIGRAATEKGLEAETVVGEIRCITPADMLVQIDATPIKPGFADTIRPARMVHLHVGFDMMLDAGGQAGIHPGFDIAIDIGLPRPVEILGGTVMAPDHAR